MGAFIVLLMLTHDIAGFDDGGRDVCVDLVSLYRCVSSLAPPPTPIICDFLGVRGGWCNAGKCDMCVVLFYTEVRFVDSVG